MAIENLRSNTTMDAVMDALYALSSSIFACTVSCSVWISWWFTQWAIISFLYKCYNVYRGRESFFELDKKNLFFGLACTALFFFALSSFLWAKDPDVAFSFTHKRMSPLAMITLFMILIPKRVPVKLLMQAYIVGSFLFIFNDLYSIIKNGLEHDIKFFYYNYPHFKHVIIECWEQKINHVHTGPTLFSALFVIVYLLKTYESTVFEKIFYGLYVVVAMPFVLFDCSRACILGFLISFIFLAATHLKLSARKNVLMICGFIAIFVLFLLIPSRFSESVRQVIFEHNFEDPRFFIWSSLLKAAGKVPFLGYGASNEISHYYEAFRSNGCDWCATAGFGSHNQFIGFFYELGIIGVVLFVAVIVLYVKNFVYKGKYKIITLPFIVMFVVSSCFDNAMQSYYATMSFMFFPFLACVKEEKTVDMPKFTHAAVDLSIAIFLVWCGVSVYKIVDYIKKDPEIVVSDLRHFRLRNSQIRGLNIPKDLLKDAYYIVSRKSHTDMWYESFFRFSSLWARVKSGSKHNLSFDYYVSEDYPGYEINITTQRVSKFVDLEYGKVTNISNPPFSTTHTVDVSKKMEWLHCEVPINGGEQYVRLEIPKTDVYMIHRMDGYVIIKNVKVEKK